MYQELDFYRKRIYKIAIIVAIIVFFVEIAMFYVLGLNSGTTLERRLEYYIYRILVPTVLNFLFVLICKLLDKYLDEEHAFWKNLIPVMTINLMCLVISYAHAFFSMTLIVFWLPIFLSVAFSDKKITRITTTCAILFMLIAVAHRYLVPPTGDSVVDLVTDAIISVVIIVVSLYMANLIVDQINDKNDKLAEAARVATEANSAKTTFLTNVSHEIRTPINAIIGMDEMILRDSQEEETIEHASDINNAAHLLLSIINEILDLSKIDSGKMEIVNNEYDLAKMITDCVNVIIFQTKAKGLMFELNIDPNLPKILYGDELRVKQVISNLLSNAYKYTQSGSIKLTVKGSAIGNELALSVMVEDTGMGISPEDIDRLFEKFERLDLNSNHKIEGTGLGLAIANGILGLMGSKIDVSSVVGEGSKFSFRLVQKIVDQTKIGEITYEEQSKKNARLHHVSIVAPKANVLIVDDNEVNIKVLLGLLSPTQINFDTANSGPQGLRLAATKKYDLIFMDHLMPDMDGVEAFHELRKDLSSASKDSPCVILTANALSGAKDFYTNEGFDAFLSKPVSLKSVEDVLLELLPDYLISERIESESSSVHSNAEDLGLPDFPGIKWSQGIECTGSKDALLATISDFVTVAKSNINTLDDFLSNEDYENFRIKIHAIKGVAATIGSIGVSELARLLEFATRDGEYDKVLRLYPVFKDELLNYKSLMKKEVLPNEEKPLLENGEVLTVLLQMLKGAVLMNDIDMSDKYLLQLQSYSYKEDLADKVEDLAVAITNLDSDKAITIIDNIMSAL